MKLDRLTDESGKVTWYFYCPGCKMGHGFDERWRFNNNLEKPTFTPSLLVNGSRLLKNSIRCHLFVKDGKIIYLSDCDHELADKTIDMEDTDNHE